MSSSSSSGQFKGRFLWLWCQLWHTSHTSDFSDSLRPQQNDPSKTLPAAPSPTLAPHLAAIAELNVH
jgi:hypothetical protein